MNIITKTAISILEVSSSFYPEKNGIFSPDQSYILRSQQTWVPFGIGTKAICGPSPFLNTMNCFSAKFKNYSKSIPIPGDLATTPVFIQNSWIIGTTKGFLFRVPADRTHNEMPQITPTQTEFWGSYSRQFIESFAPKTIYQNQKNAQTVETDKQLSKKENYIWILPTSSPFTGTPVVKNNIVYGITASQSLIAIDLETGKLLWSTKLGSQSSLYLANHSLNVTETRLLVASNRGELFLLDPKTGDQLNHIMVSNASDQENRFPNIVAAPLYTDENHILVSNTISVTKKLSFPSLETVWSYPAGSINTPIQLNESMTILLTTDGDVVNLDTQSGSVNWKTRPSLSSTISTGILTNNKTTLLIASQQGELVAVDTISGKILTQNRAIGSVVGNFFLLKDHPQESCLTFSTASFRCFKVKR